MAKNITDAIAACVMIAIMLLIGITVLGSIYDTMPTDVTQSVSAESYNTGTSATYVQLDRTNIVNNSETVTNATAFEFTKYTDYLMNNTDGTVATVISGSMANDTAHNIAYTWIGISAMATDTIPVIGNAFTLASIVVIVMAAAAILIVLTKFGAGK